jgi:hypothetical protein
MIRIRLHKPTPFGKNVFLAAFLAVTLLPLAAHLALARSQNDPDRSDDGVPPKVILSLQSGFFDGATALYITPEVGVDPNAPPAIIAAAHQVANGFNSNFTPTNFGTLPNSPAVDDIFVFTNFAQGNVLASAPHRRALPTATRITRHYGKSAWLLGIRDVRDAY